MNESKHTPGPWEIVLEPGTDALPARYSIIAGERRIGSVGTASEQRAVDAALIAAAPDMYEALRAVAREIGPEDRSTSRKVRAALAKAEGR